MTEHQLDRIHDYTKFKVVELLIKKHQEGITLKDFEEIEHLSDDILNILGVVGAKYYAKGQG
jgi:hypothetical protein